MYDDRDVPVLFAGGGLVGLSTAMFLAQHGVPSLAIERLKQGSQLPRAAFFHFLLVHQNFACQDHRLGTGARVGQATRYQKFIQS